MRFVLPLKGDMVTLGNTKATSYNQSNDIYVIPELLYTVGCETPRINYDKYLGMLNKSNNVYFIVFYLYIFKCFSI